MPHTSSRYQTILLTGGRAPAALEIARACSRAGYRVVLAESLRWTVTQASRHVAATYRVPPPRQQARAFAAALHAIVRRECVDLIVPTCEEVFHLARHVDVLDGQAILFAPPFEQLRRLHSKYLFVQAAVAADLPVPETHVVSSVADLVALVAAAPGRLVVKPEYTRFGSDVVLRPTQPDVVASLDVHPGRRWVAQAFVDGRQACVYAVAHHGRLRAYAAYGVRYTAGPASTIYFEPDGDLSLRRWVDRFVQAEAITGQIAFDFVVAPSGTAYAVECNPRATSGVHLFGDEPTFAHTLTTPDGPVVCGLPTHPRMLAIPMAIYGWRGVNRHPLTACVRDMYRADDVIACLDDPWPACVQPLALMELAWRGRVLGCGILEASTADIADNGEV